MLRYGPPYLRSLLERSHLRHRVQHFDSPFPLGVFNFSETIRHSIAPTEDTSAAEALFVQKCRRRGRVGPRSCRGAARRPDRSSGLEATCKTRERAFAAILLLMPELRPVAYSQIPSTMECQYPNSRTSRVIPNVGSSNVYYETLNSAL